MDRRTRSQKFRVRQDWIVAMGMALAVVTCLPSQAWSGDRSNEGCLMCHSEKGEFLKFADGSKKSLFVDKAQWKKSVHGGKLSCTDCHREISDYPHQKKKFEDARDYTLARANTCQRCHYAHYTRVLDSTHYEILKSGMREAPTCVDCHGAHDIHDPRTPRLGINARCATCHSEISDTFKQSVHGKALLENNPDVPVCTDCHGAHSMPSPSDSKFRLTSFQMCAQCHGDEERMKKYDLNTAVLSTYLDDFHGSSNRLYAMGAGKPTKPIATCSDCHGVHNISSFKGSATKAEARARVIKTCRTCHAEVPDSFADAWLSHYEPTFETAPLVWGVKLGYRVLIPLIMIGLVLHILLHLWRLKTHR